LNDSAATERDNDVLVRVEGVSKKFCRRLKRSLWYGLKDIGAQLVGRSGSTALRRDEFWAVDDVSFELRRGECLGLIGRNGAGKTTLLKMLNGLIKPDKGRITLCGRVGALIALGAGFNPILTGRENIYINGAILGLSKREIDRKIDDIVDFAEIGDFIDSPVQGYSSGMQVRLGFAVATALEPDILLIDEVLAVGDSRFRWKCLNRIKSLREAGVLIILVSHNPSDLMRTCSRGIVFQDGRTFFMGGIFEAVLAYGSRKSGEKDAGFTAILDSGSAVTVDAIDILVNGTSAHAMEAGDDLDVEILLNVRVAMPKVRVVVGIAHPDFGFIFAISTYRDRGWLSLEAGRTIVRLALKDLPLLFGSYYVMVSVRGPTLEVYCEARWNAPLEVIGPLPDYEGFGINGLMLPTYQWSVNPQSVFA
jgi:lipopolysaccharide transport system ATP-binding protein